MAHLDPYLQRKTDAIAARQADFTADPARAVVAITASSRVAGLTGARPTQMGEHRIISDSAPGLAGFALGPTAPELLLGALASCLVHTYLIHAALLGVPLDDVQVRTSGTLDYAAVIGMERSAPAALTQLTYSVTLVTEAHAEAQQALHAAVDAHCPVLNTLRLPASVTRDSV